MRRRGPPVLQRIYSSPARSLSSCRRFFIAAEDGAAALVVLEHGRIGVRRALGDGASGVYVLVVPDFGVGFVVAPTRRVGAFLARRALSAPIALRSISSSGSAAGWMVG
jgi:hypothetical protein